MVALLRNFKWLDDLVKLICANNNVKNNENSDLAPTIAEIKFLLGKKECIEADKNWTLEKYKDDETELASPGESKDVIGDMHSKVIGSLMFEDKEGDTSNGIKFNNQDFRGMTIVWIFQSHKSLQTPSNVQE